VPAGAIAEQVWISLSVESVAGAQLMVRENLTLARAGRLNFAEDHVFAAYRPFCLNRLA